MRIVLLCFLSLSILHGQDFDLKSIIHPAVQKLPKPKIIPDFATPPMAISTKSQKASEHVLAGIAQLNAPWDFQAYRHFVAAAQEDPDCLMAYWGVTMSLAGLNHEYYRERKAAVERMLDLLEADAGVEWEKGFCQAAGRLYSDGAKSSAAIYGAVAEKFPKNIQAKLFSLFLARDGYNEIGRPKLGQKKCLAGLEALVKANPESLSMISAWVMVHAEAPDNRAKMQTAVLPYARKLARLHPNYPPFQQVAAHVEARCGNAELAIGYVKEAIKHYQAYQDAEGVTVYDCPGLIKAKVYLATLLAGKEKFEEAYEIAEALAKEKVAESRLFSRGGSLLLWEGRSLGPRLALANGKREDLEYGLELLKVLNDEEWFYDQNGTNTKSLAASYRNALAFCIGVKKALLKKDDEAAEELYRGLIERIQIIDSESALARKTSSYAEFLRGKNAVEIFAVELRGMMAMMKEGAMKYAALTWFESAADRQYQPLNLLPPAVSYPLENRIGSYYLAVDEFEMASEAFLEGLIRMPNNLGSLRGYRTVLLELGKNEKAQEIATLIALVKR